MRSTPARVSIALALLVAVAMTTAGLYAADRAGERTALAIKLTGGNPARAPHLMRHYGCAGCHTIPGVAGADGLAGPPLSSLSQRVYIGGVLPNTPDNLLAWIVDPRAANPRTAMPVTGIADQDARDVAAYLYSIR
jgi:cytochrome c1